MVAVAAAFRVSLTERDYVNSIALSSATYCTAALADFCFYSLFVRSAYNEHVMGT